MKNLFKFPLDIQLFANEITDDNEDTGAKDNNQEDKTSKDKAYTQADIDAAVAKEKARTKARYEKQLKSSSDNDKEDVEANNNATNNENPYIEKYVQAEIKVAMVQNGIDSAKVSRAVRLIDVKDVLSDEGDVDNEKLNTTISELLKEWPELAPSKDDNDKGIRKIGSDKKENKGNVDDLIAKAFGNTN